jgi:hypothetical protein
MRLPIAGKWPFKMAFCVRAGERAMYAVCGRRLDLGVTATPSYLHAGLQYRGARLCVDRPCADRNCRLDLGSLLLLSKGLFWGLASSLRLPKL